MPDIRRRAGRERAGTEAANGAGPAPRVRSLVHEERVSLDREPILDLRRRLGPRGAEASASRALDGIAHLLAGLGEVGAADPDEMAAEARALEGLSREVGLRTLARAAAHLADAAGRCDPAAMGATLARLRRVGEASLEAVWERCAQP